MSDYSCRVEIELVEDGKPVKVVLMTPGSLNINKHGIFDTLFNALLALGYDHEVLAKAWKEYEP